VRAFIRVDDGPILLRNEIDEPDVVLVLDPTLIRVVNVTEGLKKGGIVILNTSKSIAEIKKEYGITAKVATVNATRIATENLGRPIANTTMMGALIKVTSVIAIESLQEAFGHRFGKLGEKNYKSCQMAFGETVMEGR